MTNNSRELTLFCDRTEERAAIGAFLSNLYQGNGHMQPSVLSFYGVGGVGKTRLYQKSIIDFQTRMEQDIYNLVPPKIAEVDLDSDSVKQDSPIAQILGRIRTALHRVGIKTPAFDYLYLAWWNDENPGQNIDLRRTENEKIGVFLDVGELASGLASLFGMELPDTGVLPSLHKLYSHMHNWFAHNRVQQRLDGMPESWSQAERIERMPILLASDLLDAIARQPQTSTCVVIDGFERVQSRELLPDAQRALARLVSEVLRCKEIMPSSENKLLRARMGFIILGREKLCWSKLYSNERVNSDWEHEIDGHAHLLGLRENDARSFLIDLAAPWERKHGRENVARLIEQYATQILEAASEYSEESNRSFLPYYLNLAVMLIRDNANNFDPNMLGKSPSDLTLRFLRYLKGEHRETLQALALALKFDRETFGYLVEQKFIRGYTERYFSGLVGDSWSFVTAVANRPGFHGFHRHMQESLVASLIMSEDRIRATEIVEALLRRQYDWAKSQAPADSPVKEIVYSDASNMIIAHHPTGLLETAKAIGWILKFDSLFNNHHVTALRRPVLDWAVNVSLRDMGEEHPDTLRSMRYLALTHRAQGNLPAARNLQEKVLKIYRQVWGQEYQDTLISANDLASTLWALGELTTARTLQESVLEIQKRVLGLKHSDTLTSMNNLASTLLAWDDFPAACILHKKVLEIRTRVLGKQHLDTLISMDNLASTFRALGDLPAAHNLQERLLEISRQVLDEEHPSRLIFMGNFASTLGAQLDFSAARTIQEKVLQIHLRLLGEEHLDTLTSMNNLALTLWRQNNLPTARSLLEKVLEIRGKILGYEHAHTRATRNTLAALLREQGK